MKIFFAALAVLAITTFATAAVLPLAFEDEDVQTHLEDVDSGVEVSPDSPVVRERRLTCDLFSFESKVVTPNHAACAAKCIGKGKKGGSCQGTKCVCRKDKWVG